MQQYEYKVIPAPRQGKPARGLSGEEGRFANALSDVLTEQGRLGWEYLHADALPRKSGWFGRKEVMTHVLVLRRPLRAPQPSVDPQPNLRAPRRDEAL